jgi:hypothetical protein
MFQISANTLPIQNTIIDEVPTVRREIKTCNVCVETINKSNRIAVECGFCSYVACKECCKHYLLDSKLNSHCMNCKKEWDLKEMVGKFDRKFLDTKYRSHREEVLYERERGLMVATQPIVELQIQQENRMKEIKVLKGEELAISKKIRAIQSSMRRGASNVERKIFIRKCTVEQCKGFLSSQWKCGLCENFACPKCHDVIGFDKTLEHVCNEDTLATAKLLDHDTKSCPKCSTGIFKIDGCDQMFCTACHSAFSWKTGKIETGLIHNPHYAEFQRTQRSGVIARNPNEIRCGREIDNRFTRHFVHTVLPFNGLISSDIRESTVNLIHLRMVTLPTYHVNFIHENEDLRVDYMRNKITDEAFKRRLQLKEKKMQKNHEVHNILSMFITCQTEMFYRLQDEVEKQLVLNPNLPFQSPFEKNGNRTNVLFPICLVTIDCKEKISMIIAEIGVLLQYTNTCLSSILSLYKGTNDLKLKENFHLESVKKTTIRKIDS